MSDIYNVSQVMDKTLIANSAVGVKRVASDAASVVFTIKKGQPVGVVEGYLLPSETRKTLYWMFLDTNNRAYYAEHKQGLFSLDALNRQGAVKIEDEVKQKKKDENPLDIGGGITSGITNVFSGTKDILTLGVIAVGIWAGASIVKSFSKQ
ncbi:hypothetical protein [Emticicia sp. 17c]|uniref:hypothetical protein n=1 Tax=Emticicia sp. 17c TaxID=3127704 RepID=UPI00301CB088